MRQARDEHQNDFPASPLSLRAQEDRRSSRSVTLRGVASCCLVDGDFDYRQGGMVISTTAKAAHANGWFDLVALSNRDRLGQNCAFTSDGDAQTREHNAANEITGISGTWINPTYDAAGNMISGPKSGDESTRLHFIYDAWNRLVAVQGSKMGT